MKKYLVIQIILERQSEPMFGERTNYWKNIIRFVSAKNEDEAVDRFLRETMHISAKEKLTPSVTLCEDITTL